MNQSPYPPQSHTPLSVRPPDPNDELKLSSLLKDEVARRNINLPYEIGNSESTKKWLVSLAK